MAKISVRARAVDLLGRQQIAGIPTAIHELFKNAHDAYAKRVEVDYFRQRRVLVLRDDGYGMTREEVEERWLTLGTESRIGANEEKKVWTGPKNLPKRSIMGEKGIGRLAIAAIAPITIIMTRAVRPDGLRNLVVGLVHWELFEQPGLDVQQIDVPIKELDGGTLPDKTDIEALVKQVRRNIEDLRSDIGKRRYADLIAVLERVQTDPEKLDAVLMEQARGRSPDTELLSLRNQGYGTHFILLPTVPEINDDIDGGDDSDSTFTERNLLGFSNTMASEEPPILTSFRDHKIDGTISDLIEHRAFFSLDDLTDFDQFIEGEIDEFGQFNGTVRIYRNDPVKFVCNWPGAKGRETRCGPFSLKFGYLMGLSRESILEHDKHKELSDKCERYGGLYIYRDGIRILPYGNSDFDFLDVERKRSKAAKDAFFSYRRMAGYIALTHQKNITLNEKAGREGFRQNQAYRDFRAILMNLLDRLAREYFRKGGDQSDPFWKIKDQADTEFKAAQKQKKMVDDKRRELGESLDAFFDKYEEDGFKIRAAQIAERFAKLISSLDPKAEPQEYAAALNKCRSNFYDEIRILEDFAQVTKPAGLSISGVLAKDWNSYRQRSEQLRNDIIVPLRQEISQLLEDAGRQIESVYRTEQAIAALENRSNTIVKQVLAVRNEIYQATEAFKRTLRDTVKSEFAEFKAQLFESMESFSRAAVEKPSEIEALYSDFEAKMEIINLEQAAQFAAIRDQMLSLIEDLNSGYTADTRAYIWEQRAERLEEQVKFYEDYAQMGMGLGILQHEFEHVGDNLRSGIRAIRPWAVKTKGLDTIYENLRTSFANLDGYLNVLNPIGRRMNQAQVDLNGEKIYLYLFRIFHNRIKENGIDLVSTAKFRSHVVTAKSSTVLTAFANIVDNAIYWLIEGGSGQRTITLDADSEGFLISNNGPGIPARDADLIFNFGESKKKGGTGLGLSISRAGLCKEGFNLTLEEFGENKNPTFRIHTRRQENNG